MATEIAVIQTAFLGDLLLTFPFLHRLRSVFPDARVTLVCRQGLGQVAQDFSLCAEVLEVNKARQPDAPGLRRSQIAEQMQVRKFDLIFCPHRSLTSMRWVRLSKAPVKIGFDRKVWNPFTATVPDRREFPEALRILSLLEQFDPEMRRDLNNLCEQDLHRPSFQIPTWAGLPAQTQTPSVATVGLFLGSNWAGKIWPVSHYAQLAKLLIAKGFKITLYGHSNEKKLADLFLQSLNQPEEIENQIGQNSVGETIQSLRRQRMVVANDSAGQHMGALAGCHVVSLFGPTIPEFGFRPWTNQWTLIEQSLACRPCNPHGPKFCPLGHHDCMTGITPSQVASAIFSISQ